MLDSRFTGLHTTDLKLAKGLEQMQFEMTAVDIFVG